MKEKSSIHESHKAEFVANLFMWHPVSAEIFKCWYSSCTQLALGAWLCHSTISYFNSLETSMGKPVCYYLYFFVIPINHTQTLGVRYYKKIFFFPNQCGRLQEPVRLGFPNVISTSNVHKSSCKPNFLSSDRFSSGFLFKTLLITYFGYWLFTCFIPREKKKTKKNMWLASHR